MGGFAAKQRRRVERQSLQRPQTDFNDDKNDTSSNKRPLQSSGDAPLNRRAPQQPRASTKYESRPRRRKTDHRGHASASAMKKKDIKKPKHLKRKIESISGESIEGIATNIEEKEHLLHQLEEFERKKRQLRSNRQISPIAPSVTQNKKVDAVGVHKSASTDLVDKQAWTDDEIDVSASTSRKVFSKEKNGAVEVISKTSAPLTSKNTNPKEAMRKTPTLNVTEINATIPTQESTIRKDDTSLVNSDDDDDDQILIANQNKRQRGKRLRRRGQNQKVKEDTETLQQSSNGVIVDDTVSSDDLLDPGKKSNSIEPDSTHEPEKRRCIGRKPITDFGVGKFYSGTVVYTKPFGVFIDIGCHYDAFCHVSQLSSVFIENPVNTYPIGTKLDEIRIVELDRKKKRLTVSLKKELENQSQKEKVLDDTPTNTSSIDTLTASTSNTDEKNKYTESNTDISKSNPNYNDTKDAMNDANNASTNQLNGTIQRLMSTAEQSKRDRKLARRAERRNHSNEK